MLFISIIIGIALLSKYCAQQKLLEAEKDFKSSLSVGIQFKKEFLGMNNKIFFATHHILHFKKEELIIKVSGEIYQYFKSLAYLINPLTPRYKS